MQSDARGCCVSTAAVLEVAVGVKYLQYDDRSSVKYQQDGHGSWEGARFCHHVAGSVSTETSLLASE